MKPPVPSPTSVSACYWRATASGRLELQWCNGCDSWVHYPRGACPLCHSQQLEFRQVSGRGRIYSYSTVRTAGGFASYADRVPYTIVLVTLDEGPRLIANLLDAPEDGVAIDARVGLSFEQRGQINLPQFRLELG